MKKGVSIMICTFNGASRLSKTIQHIAAQRTADLHWEVIFVDNASTDSSTEVVASQWNKYGPSNVKLTKLAVTRPGKIYALEQAFLHAQFEYAIICDDDNWLDPDYVRLVYEILEKNGRIGAVGGQSVAVNDSSIFPEWFKKYEDGYAVGQQGVNTGDISSRGHLWGAGMGTRTSLYREMYRDFPSFLTGRKGDALTAGEDAEYCQRLILRGYILYYDSRLFFYHYMPDSRLTLGYKDLLFGGFLESNSILNQYYIATSYITKYKKNRMTRTKHTLVNAFRSFFASSKRKRSEAIIALNFTGIVPASKNSVISKISHFYQIGA